MHIERIKGPKNDALKNMRNVPAIIEFLDGEIYGGMVDVCDDGVFGLYECKRLMRKKSRWIPHGAWRLYNGKKVNDATVNFFVSETKNIYVVKSQLNDDLSIDDVLQFYIDPYYKPAFPFRGVECYRNRDSQDVQHSKECDSRLHDALTIIYDCGWEGTRTERRNEECEKFFEAFRYVRRRLIDYGAKIP